MSQSPPGTPAPVPPDLPPPLPPPLPPRYDDREQLAAHPPARATIRDGAVSGFVIGALLGWAWMAAVRRWVQSAPDRQAADVYFSAGQMAGFLVSVWLAAGFAFGARALGSPLGLIPASLLLASLWSVVSGGGRQAMWGSAPFSRENGLWPLLVTLAVWMAAGALRAARLRRDARAAPVGDASGKEAAR